MNDLFRTATFRLAALFGLVVTLSTVVVFAFVYWQFSSLSLKRIDAILQDEMTRIVAQPNETLKQEFALKLPRNVPHVDYAAIFDNNGNSIYGNVPVFPKALLSQKPGICKVLSMQFPDGRTEQAVWIIRHRPDGKIVLLGRRLYEVYTLRRLVIQVLLVGLIPASLFALIIGFVFSMRSAQRLRSINHTILRIMQGNLNERLPTHGKIDDIHYVTSGVNLMLDEIVRLLDQLKNVGDNVAHDLRTRLAVVRVKLERALRQKDEYHLRTTAENILTDLDRTIATVAALLRISEIETGRRKIYFSSVDLRVVSNVVFDIFLPLAESKSITMTQDAPEPLTVLGDFDLLVEAIANLVDNAVKFTPNGGSIKITAKTLNGYPVIQIADRGPGIALEDRQNIFKRSYRSEKNSHYPGNGFGLSMAASIAELHGFTLEVEDNHPGALFKLSAIRYDLPAATRDDITRSGRENGLGIFWGLFSK